MRSLKSYVLVLFSFVSYNLVAQLREDTVTVFLDTTSFLWPCCGDTDTRGWEPKAPDQALAKNVKEIASEIDISWEPDFIKIALCSGQACPNIRYFGTSIYCEPGSGRSIYIVYHGPGYRSLLSRWSSDTLDFVLKSIVAHEIGHIAHHHPWLHDEPTRELENTCDYYTGKVMFNAWKGKYTKEQASFAIREIAKIEPSRYYYSKARRIAAIEQGYLDAKDAYERGHPDQNKSTQYAIESTHRSLYKTIKSVDNYHELKYAKAMPVFDTLTTPNYDLYPEIVSNKKKEQDSLTIVQYEREYKLCLVNVKRKELVQIGTIVPSGRSDYPYLIYDDTYYYWYMTPYMPGLGYDIYSLNEKFSDKRLLIAEIKTDQKFKFDH